MIINRQTCPNCGHPEHGIALCDRCSCYPFAEHMKGKPVVADPLPLNVSPPQFNSATIRGAWHDATCPAGPTCTDRALHAMSLDYMVAPLERFLQALPGGRS